MGVGESTNGLDEGGDEVFVRRGARRDSEALRLDVAGRSDIFGDDDEPPRRRRHRPELESDGSVYEPGSAEEDADGNPLPSDTEQVERSAYLPIQTVKPELDKDGVSLASIPSSKRPADLIAGDESSRPFKRVKIAFNHDYLDLLNAEIEDAAARHMAHGPPKLETSQIGLTVWTRVEKEAFLEALSRLGRGDIPSISRRLQSKNEFEVRQYLRALQDALAARRLNGKLAPLYPADVSAAVELSPVCCRALEDAADTVSLREEQREEAIEEGRWGSENWLITPLNHERVEAASPPGLPCLGFFRTSSWLRLPEHLFMNASSPENNWRSISDERPAIRATALQDLYSLAVSVTKRLVSATIYVSESRIRSRAELRRGAKHLVWPRDVEAAALSIGLKTDSKKFWAGCARRLGLDVFDDGGDGGDVDNDTKTEDGASHILSYDAVEAALGGIDERQPTGNREKEDEDLASLSDTPSIDELSDLDEGDDSANPSDSLSDDVQSGAEAGDWHDEVVDEDDVRGEARELLFYTAFEYPRTTRVRRVAESRVRAELRHVAHADALDACAGFAEERRLWGLLGLEEASENAAAAAPGPPQAPPHKSRTVDELLPTTPDWRERVRYVSEWERPLAG